MKLAIALLADVFNVGGNRKLSLEWANKKLKG